LTHAKKEKISSENLSCFICGDFNATSEDPVHHLISEGKLQSEHIEKYFGKSGFKFEHKYLFRDSSCGLMEKPYTSKWGVKEDARFERIDYIYFTPKTFDVIYERDPLTLEQRAHLIEDGGLPNSWNPSDHLPVAAVFNPRQ